MKNITKACFASTCTNFQRLSEPLSANKAKLYLPFANKNEVFISKARGQGKKKVFISKGKLVLLYFSHIYVKNITKAKLDFFLLQAFFASTSTN